MTEQELHKILSDAIALPAETEIVEFKEAKDGFDFDKIGKYFSALSNEANLGHGLNPLNFVFTLNFCIIRS